MSGAWYLLDDAPILGGAELFALRLAAALEDSGDAVTVVTPAEGALAGAAREAGLAVLDLPMPKLAPARAPAMPGALVATRRVLARARAQGAVVVANTAGAQAYAALAAASLRPPPRIVHLMHEQMTAARPSARLVLARSGRVVAVGANNAAVYREAVGRDDVGHLNNFLPVEAFAASAAPAPGRTPPDVAILARLTPEKGVLEAVEELAGAGGAWGRAAIGGSAQDPAYAAAVVRRLAELGLDGRVALEGFVSDTASFLDRADVLLVPSTGPEGQPTVVLEALSRGRPVVLRSSLASPDFDGLPVDYYADADGLATALARLPPFTGLQRAESARRFGPAQALAALRTAAAG